MPAKALKKSGFALIIVLNLMALLLLLVLSLTTLVRIESKRTQQGLEKLQAEQNALVGLQVALGTLQTSMGPDQRISATAEILPNTHPSRNKLTGVWVSDPNGANLNGNNFTEGQLIRWLVSDFQSESDNTVDTTSISSTIDIVGVGSLADANLDGVTDAIDEQVSVVPTRIDSEKSTGRYAWWIGDEGVKARINLIDPALDAALGPNERKLASLRTLSNSARSITSTLNGLAAVDLQRDGFASKLHQTGDLLLDTSSPTEAVVKAQFHNLTTYSRGVLADAKNGGLKQDLSLAFELSDTAFNASAFGAAGSDTITSPGFGQVQPIFRLENSTGVKANGPSWHLLRDYYTIYQRMVNPLTNPTLDAQTFLPNHQELNPGSISYDWTKQPALRYTAGSQYSGGLINSQNDGAQGDPLRSNGGLLPIPVKSSYLPYVQRHITALSLDFEAAPPPANYNNANNYEFRRLRQIITPSFVVHNPYNVSLNHNGIATAVDNLRFFIDVKSPLDATFNQTGVSGNNWHMLKVQAGTISPGEILAYAGIESNNNSDYSAPGPASGFWTTGGSSDLIIPVDPANPNAPNLTVQYLPFSIVRWAYWKYDSIAVPGVDAPIPASMKSSHIRSNKFVSNYSGQHADNIYIDYSNWYGSEDEGKTISTESYRMEDSSAPFPFFNFDFFLKPAEAGFPYPGLTHTNPLAPIIKSENLFPTSRSKPNYGWPVYAPNWQLQIYNTALTPGMDSLQTHGDKAFWGATNTYGSSTQVTAIELPTTPLVSIGQLQNANISLYAHMPAFAIGNSFASPYIPRTDLYDIFKNRLGNDRIFYDLSYLANEALWDQYFFSSYSRTYDPDADQYNGTLVDCFDLAFDPDKYSGNSTLTSLPNSRMELSIDSESVDDVRNKLFDAAGNTLDNAYQRAAENLLVKGSFNIHSTSADAWTTVLASARDMAIHKSGENVETNYSSNRTPLARILQPVENAYESDTASYDDDTAWGGFATLSDQQLDDLANAIVNEIKLRIASQGTIFTSLSAFVNRRLSEDATGLTGLLQAAIDKSGINSSFTTGSIKLDNTNLSGVAGDFPVASNILDGDGNARSTATSATANIHQGDLLQVIGSFASVRSDTFRIRSYGSSESPISGESIGQAWCEAIIQRIPKPLVPNATDPSDANYWEPLPSDVFGRKFKIIGFRWLNKDEV